MLLVNEKIKFSAKKESPNPKEVTYWIDLTEDPEGRCWKYFDSDSKRWKIFLLGVQEGTLDAYSKDESDEKFATNEALEDLADQLDGKQDELINEVNIKTINGQSILGSGDLFFDRGLNANQVGDIVEEYCKDFITVDETHEYVQDEIDKVFNRVILDRDKCPKALLDVVDNAEFDFEALKEALIAKENHLMYIDQYNGLYRFYYYDYNDTVQYTRTTVYEGLLLEDRVIINKDGVQDSHQTSKNIEFYDGGNLGGGIKISITTTNDKEDTKTDSITLLTQRQGMNYLADDGTYKRLGSVNLYTSMEGLPQQLAVLMDDNLVEINRFNEAKQYLQELNDNVYLILTDIYNEADGSRTIESNQLYTFLYDSVSDSIYIIGSINPLNQLYDGNNPLSSTKEVTQITNTAKIIRKTINSGIYANVNGFIVRVEDNQFDSVDNPLGTATTRSINFLTEGNGKDVLFNDGTYKNLQDSIDFSNFLGKDNTVPYTPTQPYHPATKKYVDDVAATKADLSDVGNVADLTTDNKTVVGAINEHETQINQHTYYINNINLTIQDIQEEIEGIHGDISDINTEINGIHSDISNINTEIDGIQQDIVTINGNIVSINNTLTQHQNTLNSHQTTLNQHQTSIDNLNSSVSTINSNITDIRGDITDINNSITDLTEWVQDFEIPIATASVLGGVKIGSGVNVTADGTISVDEVNWSNIEGKPSTFPTDWGSISGKPSSFYTLPIATDTVLGGVKSTNQTNNYVQSESKTSSPYAQAGEDGHPGYGAVLYNGNYTCCVPIIADNVENIVTFNIPDYYHEGFINSTNEEYSINISTNDIIPGIEAIDDASVTRMFQFWKDIEFYQLSRRFVNKQVLPETKIILKLYCNDISSDVVNNMNSSYRNVVFLRMSLLESSDQSSSEFNAAYLLNPSEISYKQEGEEQFYECIFNINEDCANYLNSYVVSNFILMFPELIGVSMRLNQHSLYDCDIYNPISSALPTSCSLNKFFPQDATAYEEASLFPLTNTLFSYGGSYTEHSFDNITYYKKDFPTDDNIGVFTNSTLRSVAWEIIVPENTIETTDYYVEVEDDGKMKVAIPASSSIQDYAIKYSSFTGNAGDFVESSFIASSTSQDRIATWSFKLQLPNGVNLLNVDHARLEVSLQDGVSSSIVYLYTIDITGGIVAIAAGGGQAGGIAGNVYSVNYHSNSTALTSSGYVYLDKNNNFSGYIQFNNITDGSHEPIEFEYFAKGEVYIKYHL